MPGYREIIAIALILLAWGAIPAAPPVSAETPESSESAPARPGKGEAAPIFAAPDLNGRPVEVKALLAGKPALLAFWASWCQPCIQEIPELRSISRSYRRRGFVILGVGLQEGGETPDKQRQAAARALVNYQLVFDDLGKYQESYGMSGLPYNVLLDAEGRIVWQGPLLPDDLEDRVRDLIVRSRRKEGTPQG